MKSAIEKTIWDNVSECDVDASSKGVVSKEPPKKVTFEANQRSQRANLAKPWGKDIQQSHSKRKVLGTAHTSQI